MTTSESPHADDRPRDAFAWVLQWCQEFGRPPRIMGLDVARGLAILGMAGAHIGQTVTFEWLDPTTWTDLVNGRSSILFAVLAGISVALITGGAVRPAPERMPGYRLGLIGRGAAIFMIGLALELLNTPVAVILTLYGLLYVALIPFLRWKPWQMLAAAGALAIAGPPLLALLDALTLSPRDAGLDFLLYGNYPITAWLAFALGGMALGRMRLDRVRTAGLTLMVGVVLATVGYGLGALGQDFAPNGEAAQIRVPGGWGNYPEALATADPLRAVLGALVAVEPHSGGTAELLGSSGFALAVIALCLLLSGPLRWLMLPLAALGSMPLSAYAGHLIAIFLIAGPGSGFSDNTIWATMSVTLLAAATVWSILVGRGPLERLVGWSAERMAAIPGR